MRDYLRTIFAKIVNLSPTIAALFPLIARAIQIKVAAGDAAAILATCAEIDEALDAGKALTAKIRASLAPDADGIGRLDAAEGAEIALALQEFADEAEDVGTGSDEDDPAAAGAKPKAASKSKTV